MGQLKAGMCTQFAGKAVDEALNRRTTALLYLHVDRFWEYAMLDLVGKKLALLPFVQQACKVGLPTDPSALYCPCC